MTNIIYDDKLYDPEIKKQYINTHKKGTQKNLERIFKISQPSETDLNKDIYKFTRSELRSLFFTFSASTPAASKSIVTYISGYIDWAKSQGYTSNNPLETVDVKWKSQFVVKPEKIFWTDKEIKQMLSKIVNAQVAVIFYAPFLGIKGAENAEIVNLKQKDIDADNLTVKLIDADGSEREIKVDEKFITLCQKAVKEDDYIKSNGNPDKDVRSETANLIRNEFIVRSVDIGVKNHHEADGTIVYRRFKTIVEFFDETRLTPTTIMYSGMLAKAKDLYLEGNLDHEGYELIAQQFNVNGATLKRYQNDFLNVQTIKELYDLT
ncbi:site-specific integrase [Paenibacillus sp. FSL L8-0506]|uniref:site-specific integrase n=1 Tax=Paenibacillus sp. FSL L8-0506 TaxID=2975335 RepID=UPI0030F9D4B2